MCVCVYVCGCVFACVQRYLFTVSRNFNGLYLCKRNSWALWNPSLPLSRRIGPEELTEHVVNSCTTVCSFVCVCVCVCVCEQWFAVELLSRWQTASPVFCLCSSSLLSFLPSFPFVPSSPWSTWSTNGSETAVKIILSNKAWSWLSQSAAVRCLRLCFSWKSTLPRKSPQSLQCCFNFVHFLRLQGYPFAMDTAAPAKRPTARPERGEERVQTPSSHPSLLQSLEISPGHSPHLFSPSSSLLVFIPFQTKAQNISIRLSLLLLFPFLKKKSSSILLFLSPCHSWLKLSSWSSASPLLSPPITLSEGRNAAKLISSVKLTASNHETMSSLVSCVDILGHKTNSWPFCGYMW